MNKLFNGLFALVVLPLFIQLTVCNSEAAPSEATVKLERIDIVASPITTKGVSELTLTAGNKQSFEAIGYYSDGSSRALTDLSTSDWHTSDQDIGYFNDPGVLIGGDTPGIVTVYATKNGITSNKVEVTVCSDLAGACIDIFDAGSGKLFTNSPSVAYLDSIGGSATDGIDNEDGSFGPTGDFYIFYWWNANALCATYNTQNLGGRNNWRLPTTDELTVKLLGTFGNMFNARGWPTLSYYWSATADGSDYDAVDLYADSQNSVIPNYARYASCVSEP